MQLHVFLSSYSFSQNRDLTDWVFFYKEGHIWILHRKYQNRYTYIKLNQFEFWISSFRKRYRVFFKSIGYIPDKSQFVEIEIRVLYPSFQFYIRIFWWAIKWIPSEPCSQEKLRYLTSTVYSLLLKWRAVWNSWIMWRFSARWVFCSSWECISRITISNFEDTNSFLM